MRAEPGAKRVRPYWHVDLKWISAILLLLVLGATLLLFNLSRLTERERAIKISATAVATLFSREGLDSDEGLAEFRQKAAAQEGDTITPIEQFPQLSISKEQALTLSPRELRITIFSNLTELIYDKGLEGAAADFTDDPDEQARFAQQATLLGVFTKTTHDRLSRAFLITALLGVPLLGALIYFSARWGRLVSPAIVLLLVSPVGALAGLLLLYPPRDGDGPFAGAPVEVTQEIGQGLVQSYAVAAALGALLLLGATVGKITQSLLNRRRSPAHD